MKHLITLSVALGLVAPIAVFAKPTIGSVTPTTAVANSPVTLSATVSSNTPIQRCSLWVDLAEIGDMTVADGVASRSFTFTSGGSRIAFVFCRDRNGGMNSGPTTGITVSGAIQVAPPLAVPTPNPAPTPTPIPSTASTTPISTTTSAPLPTSSAHPITSPVTSSPDIGKLLKAICPQEAGTDHPCRAVYYIGRDGKRHAFPNSRVFFTWYGGFDSVEEVELSRLSQFPLGPNVQYRAGVRMVKFTTDPKVYAVSRGGLLRWVKTEELARAYYGDTWNTKIDDIPDTFYTNYTFGTDIGAVADYNPASELANSTE